MKRKIARLQRWLDRLGTACDSQKWKSAAVEADCLSAELNEVREELWGKAKNDVVTPSAFDKIKSRVPFVVKTAAIAIVIICFSTLPIAVESGVPQKVAALPTGAESKFDEFALVTFEEKELLQLLRKNLNESNIAIKTTEEVVPERKKTFTAKTAEIPRAKPIKETPVKAAPAIRQRAENGIKAEDLLTLIQIGEKSLRGGESAIKFVN